jgi:capsular exopolysaccharide synthesis family protein
MASELQTPSHPARGEPADGVPSPSAGSPAAGWSGPGAAAALLDRRWLILGLLVAGICAGLALSYIQEREYVSSATLLVGLPAGGGGSTAASGSLASERRIAELPEVARRSIAGLGGLGLTPAQVRERTTVSARGGDALVVEARGATPQQAQRIASAYANGYLAFVREVQSRRIGDVIATLESELAALPATRAAERAELGRRIAALREARAQAGRGAALVGRPEVPSAAQSRDVARNVALGASISLLLGLALASLLGRVDRRVRRPEDLEELYGVPLLARVPRSPELAGDAAAEYGRAQVASASGFGREAEAFRSLRANLRYFPGAGAGSGASAGSNGQSARSRGIGSLLLVSPLPEEGKSTIARLLAVTMAAMGDSVCLVDADLRKGDLSATSGRGRPEGLSLVLAGFDLDEALTEVPAATDPLFDNVRVLVELRSGALPPNPSELLESERMRWLIAELERRFDTVIIDSPAIASVSDGLALVRWVSAVLIVGALGQTTRNAGRDLRKQLELLGARPIGVVANRWRPEREYSYDYAHPAAAAQAARKAEAA